MIYEAMNKRTIKRIITKEVRNKTKERNDKKHQKDN